jgi:hypothetical protein
MPGLELRTTQPVVQLLYRLHYPGSNWNPYANETSQSTEHYLYGEHVYTVPVSSML